MAKFHRTIGLAPAQFAARLDDQHFATARQAQQLCRQHGTAQAAPDDQDIGLPGDALLMSLQRCVHTALQESNHHVAYESRRHRAIVAIGMGLVAGKHEKLTGTNPAFLAAQQQGQAALEYVELLAPTVGVGL